MGGRQREGEAQGKAAQQERREGPTQKPQVPRSRDDVDILNPEPQLLHTDAQPAPRKLLGLLVTVETLFLEDQLGHAVPEESDPAVMRLGYDPENAQGSNTAQLNSARKGMPAAPRIGSPRRALEASAVRFVE